MADSSTTRASLDSSGSVSRIESKRSFLEFTLVGTDLPESYNPDADSSDFRQEATIYSSHSGRRSFIDADTQSFLNRQTERGLEEHPEARSLLLGQCGRFLTVFLLAGVVACYVGPPLLVNYAKTVGRKPDGSARKVNTFLEIVVVFFALLSITSLCMLFALYFDWRNQHENSHFRQIWCLKDMLAWAPLSAGYAIADVAEVMANGRIDAATYTVLSQLKIVGTGLAMWAFLQQARSKVQWMVLICLTFVIIAWELTPNDFANPQSRGGHTQSLGFIFTGVKVFLSIFLGVFAQKLLKGGKDIPLYIQQAQCSFISCLSMLAILPLKIYVLLPAMGEPWWDKYGKFYGLFGGEPSTEAGDPTRWDYRVLLVIAIYAFREVTITYCLKRFDAIVKTLCGAVAAVITYWLSVAVLQDVAFNHVKAMGTATIGILIVMYKFGEETAAAPSKTK